MAASVAAIARADLSRPREFVVDFPAKMLRRNERLSKNARHLYVTLRALADGDTGQLKIKGRWRKAKEFDAAAEICRDVRLAAMRELIDAGLVGLEFEMAVRFIGGRRRAVRSRSQYTVHRTAQEPNDSGGADPQFVEKPRILLKSISSTVEEIDSQDLSKLPPPATASGGVVGVPSAEKRESDKSSSRSSPPKADDDLFFYPDLEALEPKIQEPIEKAKTRLLKDGLDPHLVSAGLQLIEERADYLGTTPQFASYFIVAFRAAMADPRDKAAILERVANPSAKEAQNSRIIGARNAREASELAVKTETNVGGIPMDQNIPCIMCGLRFSCEEYAEHVCPEEQKSGMDTRRHQRADAGARAKGAAA
jgi:hypothetical protein